MWKKIKPYVISIAIALAVGGLAAFLTRNDMDIYKEIVLPPLAPPSILFPIVWSILYVLMGISAAMIYLRKDDAPNAVRDALSVYGINLVLNFMWSIIFFKFRVFLFAFIWLLALFAVIIKMIFDFRKIKPISGYLQIPYAVWVAFAGYLNFAIWILNR
jgi:tryptophan-rich sensory protein